jgi:hypothetical protein
MCPGRNRERGAPRCPPGQQHCDRARRRQGEEHPVLVLFALRCHLQEGAEPGGGLGRGPDCTGQGGGRRAWCRLSAAHASRCHMAWARHVVAAVRALCRSPVSAWSAFSPFPRTQSWASYPRCGGSAAKEVTTTRGLSPAALTSAVTSTRHGWAPEAAA